MEANILIQRLQQGEIVLVKNAAGDMLEERRAPTSTALQAARTLQKLLEINEGNMRIITQLTKDNESLHEQIKSLQSNNNVEQTSGADSIS